MSAVDRLICHVLPKAYLMALVAEGRLAELQIVRRDRPSRVENVFLGRLERVMPDLDAAFVDIGIGRSGFLRAEDRAGIDGWPLPGAPWVMRMRWSELLFAHWAVEPEVLRPFIPAGLELELFEGRAWIGLVPLLTGAYGFCPLYPVFKINTAKKSSN